jgi:hypothetical protein
LQADIIEVMFPGTTDVHKAIVCAIVERRMLHFMTASNAVPRVLRLLSGMASSAVAGAKIKTTFMVKKIMYVLFLYALTSCNEGNVKDDVSAEEWTPLFNNKGLSGWEIKITGQPLNDNYKNTFRWEDSVLRVAYDRYDSFSNKFGHIYSEASYSYYKLRFQYRITGSNLKDAPEWCDKNSGVMLHSQPANSMNINQSFPVSLEMQFLEGSRKGENTTGNLCTPGTQVHMNGALMKEHCISSTSEKYTGDQWVDALVEVYGDSLIRHIINGDTVLTYTNAQIGGGYVNESLGWAAANITDSALWISKAGTPLKEGHIAFQAESQPVDFRRVELLELSGCTDPKAKNYKSYYVKDNGKCTY